MMMMMMAPPTYDAYGEVDRLLAPTNGRPHEYIEPFFPRPALACKMPLGIGTERTALNLGRVAEVFTTGKPLCSTSQICCGRMSRPPRITLHD